MAIIKQSEARMNDMKEAMSNLAAEFEKDYPLMRFELSQDQTGILDYTIGNLKKQPYPWRQPGDTYHVPFP
jgi:hypothetical protein